MAMKRDAQEFRLLFEVPIVTPSYNGLSDQQIKLQRRSRWIQMISFFPKLDAQTIWSLRNRTTRGYGARHVS